MPPFASTRALFLLAIATTYHASTCVALAISAPRTVLVTGGAGYIGSHTCLELLNAGGDKQQYKVVVVDNLDNSSEESLKRVAALTNCEPGQLVFRNCDLRYVVHDDKS
jgi:nucleoside-diphosphate-sugar epimerase